MRIHLEYWGLGLDLADHFRIVFFIIDVEYISFFFQYSFFFFFFFFFKTKVHVSVCDIFKLFKLLIYIFGDNYYQFYIILCKLRSKLQNFISLKLKLENHLPWVLKVNLCIFNLWFNILLIMLSFVSSILYLFLVLDGTMYIFSLFLQSIAD